MTLLLLKRAPPSSRAMPSRILAASLTRPLSTPSLVARAQIISRASTWRLRHEPTRTINTPRNSILKPSSGPARWFSLTKWRSSPPEPTPGSSQPVKNPRLKKVLPSALTTPHENIYTIPNMLTVSRLILAPVIGYCIVNGHHNWALGLFAYAGISDLLDGWIARKWNLGTVVGTIIDPLADKTLMTVLTVSLAMQGALPGE
jgi:hypothetical protein